MFFCKDGFDIKYPMKVNVIKQRNQTKSLFQIIINSYK